MASHALEEWRIQGSIAGQEFEFIWSPERGHDDPRESCETFATMVGPRFDVPPVVTKRIITIGPWGRPGAHVHRASCHGAIGELLCGESA